MTQATTSNYWIANNGITITLNALSSPNYTQCSVSSGAVIMCFVPGLKNGESDAVISTYDNGHNYRRWTLRAYPTVFLDNTAKYVYVQIPRDATKTEAMVVFPSQVIDIYGCSHSHDGYEDDVVTQVGSTDYYYINLQGVISATDGSTSREWTTGVQTGELSTNAAIDAGGVTGSWWSYSSVDDIVTFLKNITFKASFKFLSLVAQTLNVTGLTTLGGKLTVSAGGADITGDTKIKGDADITGDTNISGGADITGDTNIGGKAKITGAVTLGDNLASSNFVEGAPTAGSGWQINHNGDIEGESIKLRGFMEVPEIRFNRASVIAGTSIQSPCGGVIQSVYPIFNEQNISAQGVAILELGDDDIAGSIQEGALCWGYFHDVTTKSNNATDNSDDRNGQIEYKGFATVYFQISRIYSEADKEGEKEYYQDEDIAALKALGILDENGEGTIPNNSTVFRYELRPDILVDADNNPILDKDGNEQLKYSNHPYVGMNFGGRGNTKDADLQGFIMSTPNYTAIYQLVSSWDMSAIGHIVKVSGLLDGFEVLAGETPGTWKNEYGTIDCNVYMRGNIQQVTDSERILYITEESNGIIEEGETEKVTIVIRDNWFQDRTSGFTVTVENNGVTKTVHTAGSTEAIVLEYPYANLPADINRYTVKATGTRQVRKLVDGQYKYVTEDVTLTDTFVIRKETPVTLSVVTNIDNDPFIDNTEPKHVICAVETNKGVDMTSEVTKWSIERGDYVDNVWTQSDADKVWGQRSKVTGFNGTIDLYWSSDTDLNDLDLTKEATKFRITATMNDGTEKETTLSI